MSLPKDIRSAEPRRRERPNELDLESAHAAPTSKKTSEHQPLFRDDDDSDGHIQAEVFPAGLDISKDTAATSSPDSANRLSEQESYSATYTHNGEAAAAPSTRQQSYSPPSLQKISPKMHVRTSSLGIGSKSPESPKTNFASRKGMSHLRHERRDSLLGRSWAGTSNSFLNTSPPSSPNGTHNLSSSLKDGTVGAVMGPAFQEMDTDSDDDSPFPPPISYTDQVSNRNITPSIRVRPSSGAPVNHTSSARKTILAGIIEKRKVQERSLNHSHSPNHVGSPHGMAPPSPTGISLTAPEPIRWFRLERGGVVVQTKSQGRIQFGIPPETIKDSLASGFDVPSIYIVPRDRFDTIVGLNMCEVEFPGYYQFFIKKHFVTLVASREAENSIRQLMHEILQGPPEEHLYTNEECLADYEARPDHVKEMAFFVRPREGRSIDVDSLFKFIHFEPSGQDHENGDPIRTEDDEIISKARLSDRLVILETTREWIVVEDDEEIARVEFWLASTVPVPSPTLVLPTKQFIPPTFGVTVLGSSHGFDPKQSTSGFVLWMHGKGIMVDPPPNATELLRRSWISPRWISAIILTHCHADHDAGTFQKILVEGRVTLMTTKTIMASFLRKYAKISGFTEAFLCRLFEPRVVRIGEDVFYSGGTIRFHYSFHALPCIGFQASVAGKSIAYSADTLYEPKTLNELCEEGVLSKGRRDSLLSFPFETADVVIHEAGIPPIHTPVEVLKSLSEKAQKGLYLIHIAEEKAEQSGLRLAKPGTDNTIRVIDGDAYAFSLDVLTNSELFFPYLASAYKFGRGIVLAAQERLIDYDHPHASDYSFLDCTNAQGSKRFYTSSAIGNRERSSSMAMGSNNRSSSLGEAVPNPSFPAQMHQQNRDSDLSLSSVKRHSAGFENVSPTRNFITGRRTSASTNKSLLFASDHDEEDFTVPQVADLLRLSKRIVRDANEIVSANEGEGDKGLYLIMRGFCRVAHPRTEITVHEDLVQPAEGREGTILEPGDCFGMFVVNESRENRLVRKCVIRTLTEVELIELDMNALWYLLNVYPALDRRLSRMHDLRAEEAWKIMDRNSCLRRLASFQRTQLYAVLEPKEFKKGEELWTKKAGPRHAYLVAEGQLVFSEISDEMSDRPFEAGAFLCDFHSMIANRRSSTSTMSTNPIQPNTSHVPATHGMPHIPHASALELIVAAETSTVISGGSLTSGEHESHQVIPMMTLVARTDCKLYQLNWKDAFQFLESNPGVLVQIYHSLVVE